MKTPIKLAELKFFRENSMQSLSTN